MIITIRRKFVSGGRELGKRRKKVKSSKIIAALLYCT